MSYNGPEDFDEEAQAWLEAHASEIPDEPEDEIGNGTVVSYSDVVGTDDEPYEDPTDED